MHSSRSDRTEDLHFHYDGTPDGGPLRISFNPEITKVTTGDFGGKPWAEIEIEYDDIKELVLEHFRSKLVSSVESMDYDELQDFLTAGLSK